MSHEFIFIPNEYAGTNNQLRRDEFMNDDDMDDISIIIILLSLPRVEVTS